MEQKKGDSWFKDIIPPPTMGLGQSAGYLDRLIAGGDRTERQHLPTNSRKNFASRVSGQKNGITSNKKSGDKKPFAAKLPSAAVDDASWIADRKKKFPKVNGHASHGDTTINRLEEKVHQSDDDSNRETKPNSSPDKTTKSKASNKHSRKNPVETGRRLTLFERLTKPDQQTN